MSSNVDRAFRARHFTIPFKVTIVQVDGSETVQHVDADARSNGKAPIARRIRDEEAIREVRRALNEYYYGGE
jgi:hypothetical protein